MAFIKTDPSQTKTVIVLLVVLAGALAFVFVRLRPEATAAPAAPSQPTTKQPGPADGSVDVVYASTRNPFKRPDGFATAASEAPGTPGDGAVVTVGPAGEAIGPMPVPPGFGVTPEEPNPTTPRRTLPSAAGAGPAEKPQPEFALLATVKDTAGYSAIVRSGESDTVVVQVGDRLAGGFRVREIAEEQVVLTDGRDTIVVKRPRA